VLAFFVAAIISPILIPGLERKATPLAPGLAGCLNPKQIGLGDQSPLTPSSEVTPAGLKDIGGARHYEVWGLRNSIRVVTPRRFFDWNKLVKVFDYKNIVIVLDYENLVRYSIFDTELGGLWERYAEP